MTNALRSGGLLAIAIGIATFWIVTQTVQRANASNQLVIHTQRVLSAVEAVGVDLADAERGVRQFMDTGAASSLQPLADVERSLGPDLDRVTALTRDNGTQQSRLRQLDADARLALSALRQLADAASGGRGLAPQDITAHVSAFDDARATMRAIRTEEERLLDERARANERAVSRLQQLAIALGVVAAVLGGWAYAMTARRVKRAHEHATALTQENASLEAQVDAQAGELRASNARLQSVIDSAVDAIIVISGRGVVESFNRGAERLFGYAAGDVIGRNVSMLMPSPDHERHDGYLANYQRSGAAQIIGIGREVTGRRRDGTTFPLHLSVGEMMVDGERKFTGILHDLSERVRIEAQLREQAALARIGEMAAVIAHEVKNPLAGVRGAIQVIGGRLPAGSGDSAIVGEIIARIDALDGLMKDLLLYARPPQPRPAPIDLAQLVTSTAELFSSDPTQHIQVNIAGSAPPVVADGDLLKIVFVNLLVNAGHAMQGRGTIEVSLSTADGRCCVTVADQGPGIPAEVREKIFVPFFTTKSRGSGLGLPTAKRFIDAHRGRIDVTCPPTGGTVVTVELPQSAA